MFFKNDIPGNLSNACFLPKSFVPGKNDVIIGRGKKCHGHFGNKRLKYIVLSRLDEYSQIFLQSDKSLILRLIVSQIRNYCHPRVGGFVKQDPKTKRWYDVGDSLAREKISKSFRDALNKRTVDHHNHRSNRKKRNNMTNATTTNFIGVLNNSLLGGSTRLIQIDSLSQKLERSQSDCLSSQCSAVISEDSESSLESSYTNSKSLLRIDSSCYGSRTFFEERIEPELFSMQPSKKNDAANFDFLENFTCDLDDTDFKADMFDEPNNIQNTTEIDGNSYNSLEEIDIQGLDFNGLNTPLHDNFFYSPSAPIQQAATIDDKKFVYPSPSYTTNQKGTRKCFKPIAAIAKGRKKPARFNIIASRQA